MSKYINPNAKDTSNQQNNTETMPEEDLLFLKNCVIKNTDMHVIISKLNSTRDLRKSMMMNQNIDLRESFPFFISDPKLVSYFGINPSINQNLMFRH